MSFKPNRYVLYAPGSVLHKNMSPMDSSEQIHYLKHCIFITVCNICIHVLLGFPLNTLQISLYPSSKIESNRRKPKLHLSLVSLSTIFQLYHDHQTYSQWTYVFITLDFTLYISYKTTFVKKKNCEVISKRNLIIFAPEEAEIFKDYLFTLEWFSARLLLFSYDLKTICFSDVKMIYI